MASPPVRYPNGVTTVTSTNPLGMYGMPDPTEWVEYFNDFHTYVAADWTITKTEAGAGSATAALTDINGGALLVTNDNADNDNSFFQKVGEGFLLAANKRAFFKCRFKTSDATQSDIVFGLQVTDTTPLDVTDGIYFLKADDAATVDLICRKDASTGTNSDAAIATLSDDTFVTLAWYYDGASSVKYYVNDVFTGEVSGASTYLPDTELTISFGIQNGAAAAKTLTVDYLFAALER